MHLDPGMRSPLMILIHVMNPFTYDMHIAQYVERVKQYI